MATIKVYPPTQLPDRGVSETQFKIWVEELEVYLSQVDRYEVFLAGGEYSSWESQENNEDRLTEVKGEDANQPGRTTAKDNANLKKRQRDLRTVLSIVGKCVSQGHYDAVVRHSTSMQWIFNMLRCDYDIQQKGIHFFNILDLKYDSSKSTPIAFFNQYRNLITNNLSRKNDVIKYKNNLKLTNDEKMSPMLEDMVLLNVLKEIEPRLPSHVRTHYTLKMSKSDKLMDFKNDIMNNIPKFLQELERDDQLNSIQGGEVDPQLSWIKQQKGGNKRQQNSWGDRKQQSGRQDPHGKQDAEAPYCRLCFKSGMPAPVYSGHDIGDRQCPQLSYKDRMKLERKYKMNNISAQLESITMIEHPDEAVNSLARELGYREDGKVETSPTQM